MEPLRPVDSSDGMLRCAFQLLLNPLVDLREKVAKPVAFFAPHRRDDVSAGVPNLSQKGTRLGNWLIVR
jgi:hypothetical protein